MKRSPPKSRGFTIVELLMVLVLLGTTLFVAGRLFETTIRVGQSTAQAQDAAASLDAAVTALRADAWAASSLEIPNAQAASLKLPRGRSVAWTITAGSILRQEPNQPPQRWNVPDGAAFVAEDVELVLRFPQTKSHAGGEVRLPRETQLLQRLAS